MTFVNEFFNFDSPEEMVKYLARPEITVQLIGNGWADATNGFYIGDADDLVTYLNTKKYRLKNPSVVSTAIKERLK